MSDASGLFSDGEAYERLMGRWSRRVGEGFLEWLNVPHGRHWLDVGCGNGAFTEDIIARCAPAVVIGIDPSEDQLAYARNRENARAAMFLNGDAQTLPFNDDTFDVAAMALVISFVSDPPRSIAEMTRVVRPGGLIASYMWDFEGGGVPSYHVAAATRLMGLAPALPPNAAASSIGAMQRMWKVAGLDEVETRVIDIPVMYSSFEDYWATHSMRIGPTGQMIARLNSKQKEDLSQHLLDLLPIAGDGKIAFKATANAVKGRVS